MTAQNDIRRNFPCWVADVSRVRQVWHEAGEVEVLWPGICRADDQKRGKEEIVRWGLEEIQFKLV